MTGRGDRRSSSVRPHAPHQLTSHYPRRRLHRPGAGAGTGGRRCHLSGTRTRSSWPWSVSGCSLGVLEPATG